MNDGFQGFPQNNVNAARLQGVSIAVTVPADDYVLTYDAASKTWGPEVASGGGGAWGSITGTLSDQADLQSALDAKLGNSESSGPTTLTLGAIPDGEIVKRVGTALVGVAESSLTNLQALFVATAAATVGNSTSETSIIGTVAGSKTIPANFLDVGRVLRGSLSGQFSSTAVTPSALTLKVKLGSTVIATTGSVTPVASLSGEIWTLDFEIVCRSTGASGSVIGRGEFRYGDSSVTVAFFPLTDAAATVDTTGTLVLDVTMQYGTAATDDTITCEIANAEAFEPGTVPSSGNATQIQGVPVDESAIADTYVLAYDAGGSKIIYAPPGGGGGGITTQQSVLYNWLYS